MTTQQRNKSLLGSALGGAARLLSVRLLLLLGAIVVALSLGLEPAVAQQSESAPLQVSVNINQDEAAVLAERLTGVGLARAEDIIRYREEFGPFTTVEQLAEVKGIGKATLDKNRARITLD